MSFLTIYGPQVIFSDNTVQKPLYVTLYFNLIRSHKRF